MFFIRKRKIQEELVSQAVVIMYARSKTVLIKYRHVYMGPLGWGSLITDKTQQNIA